MPFQRRLALLGPIGEPIWCSMCGAALVRADHPFADGEGFACQCRACCDVLAQRVRRIMVTAPPTLSRLRGCPRAAGRRSHSARCG